MSKTLVRMAGIALGLLLMFSSGLQALAAVSEAEMALAQESEAKCAQTAKNPATPQIIEEKVKQAAALLEKEGKAAFPKFKGKNSEFIFGGTYIWIHDLNTGVMLMHPVKPLMVGQKLIGLKDGNGKRFFVEMNQVVRTHNSGWVDYTWPKPGETTRSQKVSFVHKAMCDGKEVVLGCGIYDKTKAEILKALESKP